MEFRIQSMKNTELASLTMEQNKKLSTKDDSEYYTLKILSAMFRVRSLWKELRKEVLYHEFKNEYLLSESGEF